MKSTIASKGPWGRLGIAAALFAAGCAASPEDRLSALAAEVDAARAQGIERWAPAIVAEAASLVAAAGEEIDQQRGRRFSVRTFRVARLLLDDAEHRLEAARKAAREATSRARAEADAKLQEAASAVESVRALRRSVPSRPDTADDLAGLDADLGNLEHDLETAHDRFGAGFFLEAADAADRVAARGRHMAAMVRRSLPHDLLPATF